MFKLNPQKLENLLKEEMNIYEESCDNIMPSFKEKELICLSSSDIYAKYTSVVLLSIVKNSDINNNYDIAILTSDLSVYNKQILSNIVAKYPNFRIRFFNISEKIKNYTFYTWAHFTINTYFRLLIPELFKNYKKVLYLDSDIVVNTDICKIFNYDIGDNYVAAAIDTHVLAYCSGLNMEQYEYNKNVLQLKNPKQYFQMGVAIYNIRKILEDFSSTYLIEYASKHNFKWLDQDVLNKLFHNKIKKIPVAWNLMIANKFPYVDEYYLPEEVRTEYCNARLKPAIIHYCGGLCFQYKIFPDMGYLFWHYARMSPFYEEILAIKLKAVNAITVEDFNSSIILRAVYNFKKNCLQYWRCKILYKLTKGKLKQHYLVKKDKLKTQIKLAKSVINKK